MAARRPEQMFCFRDDRWWTTVTLHECGDMYEETESCPYNVSPSDSE
jgi:hypothetical protein